MNRALTSEPPVVLPVVPENIPALLKLLPQWVGWQVGPRRQNGKYEKRPTNYHGHRVNAHDPKNWMTFERALASNNSGKCDGIGFDLNGEPISSDEQGNLYLVGIDIDSCVSYENDRYEVDATALDVWHRLGSPYLEISPSGTGVRMFVLSRKTVKGGNRDHHEMYGNARFLTVTGHGEGSLHEATDAVTKLQSEWFPGNVASGTSAVIGISSRVKAVSPPEIPQEIDRLQSALHNISADTDRDTWRDVVWAIASTGWSCAESIAREWSETAKQRYTEDGFQNVWNSYEPGRGIHVGTLYHHAIEAGWHSHQNVQIHEGDILNGKLFAEAYRGQLMFIDDSSKVLKFDQTGWVLAPPGDAEMLAKELVAKLRLEALAIWAKDPDSNLAKTKLSHASKSSMEPRLKAMISMAKSEQGMTKRLSELDANNDLIGLMNGVYDLKTDALLKPRPDLLVSKRTSVNYVPHARCPMWMEFLNTVQPDKSIQRLLQQLSGAFLSGDSDFQKLIILYGLGANGKTTFIEVLHWLLGDYGLRINTEMLMYHQRSPQSASPDIVSLKGCRLAYCNEIPENGRLDEARVKDLTGGDTLSGRAPYAHSNITFSPTHKLVMVGNHKPEIHDMSQGMWRRLLLIPFDVTIPPLKRDPYLMRKLKVEGEGILIWALAGYRDLVRHGLRIPRPIVAAVDAYKDEEDLIGEWLDAHCIHATTGSVPISDCYKAYRWWARSRGHMPLAQSRLTRKLKERNIHRDPGKRNFQGLTLNADGLNASRFSVY